MTGRGQAAPEGWQEKFFELFTESGNVSRSSEAAGVTRDTVYYHCKINPDFKERFDTARKESHLRQGHRAFAAAYKRAIDGWDEPVYQSGELVGYKRKYSDRLLELLLKKLDADTFGDDPVDDKDRNIRIEFVPVADVEADESADADDSE